MSRGNWKKKPITDQYSFDFIEDCSACDGSGYHGNLFTSQSICQTCKGSGLVHNSEEEAKQLVEEYHR